MSYFFPDSTVPTSYGPLEALLHKLSKLKNDQIKDLQLELDLLDGVKLHRLCHHVLSKTSNENVFKALGKSSVAIGAMSATVIGDYFELLVKCLESELVDEYLFEEVLASLIKNYSGSDGGCLLYPLANALRPIIPDNRYMEDTYFPEGDDLDEEMSRHLAKALNYTLAMSNEFEQVSSGLRRLELPKTLGVFVQNKINSDAYEYVSSLITNLFHADKLPFSYLSVLRGILGDGFIVESCLRGISSSTSLKTIKELSLVMGEGAFHTPEVLSSIVWHPESERQPSYIQQFRNLGFDEKRFPILADFVCKNFESVLRFSGKDYDDRGFIIDAVNLGARLGKVDLALDSLLRNIAKNVGSDRNESLSVIIKNLCRLNYDLSSVSMEPRRSYSLLVDVFAEVGLQELQKLNSQAPSRFVMDIIAKSRIKYSGRELSIMFPQARGDILEDELGM